MIAHEISYWNHMRSVGWSTNGMRLFTGILVAIVKSTASSVSRGISASSDATRSIHDASLSLCLQFTSGEMMLIGGLRHALASDGASTC
jgi:hypothetical protein